MRHILKPFLYLALSVCGLASYAAAQTGAFKAPRTADGKPDLSGIWQAEGSAAADLQDHAASFNIPAGRSVLVGGGTIPYLPAAAAQKTENFKTRLTTDPVEKCFVPGVPRIMYMNFPFQIFQTPKSIAMTFEWSLAYRLIYTDGSKHPADLETWMGDSRGHWEGDTLVVDESGNNDQTWLDMAGDFHSEELRVVERYNMIAADTIQYEATIEDPKVFSKPWTIRVALKRRTDRDRLFEYACEAEAEEANGAFTREERTWYPGKGTPPPPMAMTMAPHTAAPAAAANIHRMPDGKPDLQGVYNSNTGGASQGLEKRAGDALTPVGRGIVADPPDGKLPLQPWAVEERISRNLPERGYDDPTAHSFPPGTPRAMHVPAAFEIVQTPDYIVFLHERIAWRIVPLNGRPHLPENMRLWQGDNVGHWEGDTLVIDTTNLNGKAWLSEGGDIISYAAHVVERITPTGPDGMDYQAVVYDPVVYSKPWTVAYPIRRVNFELPEAASHEEDRDLPHLKLIKDQAAAAKKKQ